MVNFIFAVLVGFAVLIYLLLKYRDKFQQNNRQMSSDQAWGIIAAKTAKTGALNFSKSQMIYGVWQDAGYTKMSLLIKDSSGETIGELITKAGSRTRELKIKDQIFLIEFPLTWNRTATLRAADDSIMLARYEKTGWFIAHQFDIPGYGKLKSEWPGLNFRAVFNYRLNDKVVGFRQMLSGSRDVGLVAILPLDIPIEVRLFILAL